MVKHTIVINMNKKTSLKSLSRFLQILDGTFPSGVFVHSFGLEPHIIKQSVKDINTLNEWLVKRGYVDKKGNPDLQSAIDLALS